MSGRGAKLAGHTALEGLAGWPADGCIKLGMRACRLHASPEPLPRSAGLRRHSDALKAVLSPAAAAKRRSRASNAPGMPPSHPLLTWET